MPVARLRLRIITTREREDAQGNQEVTESSREVELGIGRLGRVLSRGRGMQMWIKVSLLASPALYILAKHLLGLAGGLATMGVVVAAAAAPWVGLAVTAAMNADKMGRAGDQFQRGTKAVGRAWMKLARDTAPETLGPVTDVLNGIAAAIPKLEPLVREISPDMARMGRDIKRWLSGRGFERFLQNIEDYGVPAFRNLVVAGKDFLATIGIGFRQFLPLAEDIATTLRRGARDMRENAESGGIARWLRDWKANSQVANRFLKEAAESIGIMGQLLNDMGPGMLHGINAGLTALNAINPYTLIGIILAFATGSSIIGLVAALRMFQAIRALRAVSFVATVAQLGAAAAALNAAAVVISGLAASIQALADMVAGLGQRFRVNTGPLDRIRQIWEETPKNATATLTVNLSAADALSLSIGQTWGSILNNMVVPAGFVARADFGAALGAMAAIGVAWAAVAVAAFIPAAFTAFAIDTASIGMSAMLVAWARVRAMATLPALFVASATPGNVPGVANTIVAAWARVRAAARIRPFFTARGISSNVSAGAALIVGAWMRVVRMPRVWVAVGIVRPGNVPSASARIWASWRALYGLARTWSGVAVCVFSGGFPGIPGIGGPVGGGGGGGPMHPSMGGGEVELKGGYGPLPGPVVNFLDKIPGFNPGDFGSVDMGDYLGGGDPFYPDDFEGGFGDTSSLSDDFAGGFASGGPIGKFRYGQASAVKTGGGHRGKTLHIHEDVWIRSEQDLIDILMQAK